VAAILLLIGVLVAQAFDAASLKRSAPDNPNGSTFEYQTGGNLRVQNGTLRGLIESAYDVRDFQIFGGPSWLNTDRFDVVARSQERDRAASPADEMKATRLKLRLLLETRFGLSVHHETRKLQQYTLVPQKGGVKLKIDPDTSASRTGIQSNCGHLTATRATTANLAYTLSRRLRRPVVDLTGLTGVYTFQLDWSSDVAPCTEAPSDGPSIFTALEEQLGLKLESIKAASDVIVIDGAHKPSED
jgi:bla regulator protein blaR1